MQNLYCATNALIKWLKIDLPRLPAAPGQQVGVNTVISDSEQMCWQWVLAETLRLSHILPRSDIALQTKFNT